MRNMRRTEKKIISLLLVSAMIFVYIIVLVSAEPAGANGNSNSNENSAPLNFTVVNIRNDNSNGNYGAEPVFFAVDYITERLYVGIEPIEIDDYGIIGVPDEYEGEPVVMYTLKAVGAVRVNGELSADSLRALGRERWQPVYGNYIELTSIIPNSHSPNRPYFIAIRHIDDIWDAAKGFETRQEIEIFGRGRGPLPGRSDPCIEYNLRSGLLVNNWDRFDMEYRIGLGEWILLPPFNGNEENGAVISAGHNPSGGAISVRYTATNGTSDRHPEFASKITRIRIPKQPSAPKITAQAAGGKDQNLILRGYRASKHEIAMDEIGTSWMETDARVMQVRWLGEIIKEPEFTKRGAGTAADPHYYLLPVRLMATDRAPAGAIQYVKILESALTG